MPVILQLTDLHVMPKGELAFGRCDTAGLLTSIQPWLAAASQKVDAVVVTGDIGCDGNEDAYRIVRDVFSGLAAPVRMVPGNHDRRAGMAKVLGDFLGSPEERFDPASERFDQSFEAAGARVILLDTLQPGKHWGGLTPAVLDALSEKLDEARSKKEPALVCMHHTPLHCGMGVMDEDFAGRSRLFSILAQHPEVRLATGHMHRAIVQAVGPTVVATAPSVACPIMIDLRPEGGDEYRFETPGFAIHNWKSEPEGIAAGWTTFFGLIPVQTSFAGPYRFKNVVNPVDD